jgi:hypothetical protein
MRFGTRSKDSLFHPTANRRRYADKRQKDLHSEAHFSHRRLGMQKKGDAKCGGCGCQRNLSSRLGETENGQRARDKAAYVLLKCRHGNIASC